MSLPNLARYIKPIISTDPQGKTAITLSSLDPRTDPQVIPPLLQRISLLLLVPLIDHVWNTTDTPPESIVSMTS
jgi:hypothetical protein